MLEAINHWAAVIGLILTGIGLIAVAYQLLLTRKLARNDFSLRFYDQIQYYNPVHLRLATADWHNSTKGPESPEEWNNVRRYMGLLEALWQLINDGVYPKERADRDYSHRVIAIVMNPVIREQCFVNERLAWLDFIHLWACLESCEVYRGLAEEHTKNDVSVPKAISYERKPPYKSPGLLIRHQGSEISGRLVHGGSSKPRKLSRKHACFTVQYSHKWRQQINLAK